MWTPTGPAARRLRGALLRLHKAMLDAERTGLERTVGALSGGEYLQVVMRDARMAWLRPLTELVANLDTALAHPEEEGNGAVLDGSFAGARALIAPPSADTPFGARYLQMLQEDPSVVLAHAATMEELRRAAA